MPVRLHHTKEGDYYQWGGHGKKYFFNPKSPKSKTLAHEKAERQGRAAYAAGYLGRVKRMVFYKGGKSLEMEREMDEGYIPDMMGYHKVKKEVVQMTPEEFIQRAGCGWPDDNKVDCLMPKIASKKIRVDTPYLIYVDDNPYDWAWSHSGRHRATAAKRLGIRRIPVVVLYYESISNHPRTIMRRNTKLPTVTDEWQKRIKEAPQHGILRRAKRMVAGKMIE